MVDDACSQSNFLFVSDFIIEVVKPIPRPSEGPQWKPTSLSVLRVYGSQVASDGAC